MYYSLNKNFTGIIQCKSQVLLFIRLSQAPAGLFLTRAKEITVLNINTHHPRLELCECKSN